MTVGIWHCALFLAHLLALLITLGLGIYLIIKHNYIVTVEETIQAFKDDPKAYPAQAPPEGFSKKLGKDEEVMQKIKLCFMITGIVCLVIACLIAINLYCFLAVILEPDSAPMRILPGMAMIRQKMEVEVAHQDVGGRGGGIKGEGGGGGSEPASGGSMGTGSPASAPTSMSSPASEGGDTASSSQDRI